MPMPGLPFYTDNDKNAASVHRSLITTRLSKER